LKVSKAIVSNGFHVFKQAWSEYASCCSYNGGYSLPPVAYSIKQQLQASESLLWNVAEVESHPFDLDTMLFMDWRDDHLADQPDVKARNDKLPTFLYAMPFTKDKVGRVDEAGMKGG
jgi:hypothetical protein